MKKYRPDNRIYGMDAIDRFWCKVSISDSGCWQWLDLQNYAGYGRFWFNGKMLRAHKFSYNLFIGEVPEGLELDHLCRNRLCVNPEHLEAVAHQANSSRGEVGAWERAKTHCPRGHPYDEKNTYLEGMKRKCRTCMRLRQRKVKYEEVSA